MPLFMKLIIQFETYGIIMVSLQKDFSDCIFNFAFKTEYKKLL